jgi:nicotinamidase-related amidase
MGGLKEDLGRNAVHLCIDMQRLFSDEGVWPTRWLTRVLPNVIALAEHAPPRTIFTRFVPPRFAEDATGQWRLYYSKWPEALRNHLDPRLLELLPSLAASFRQQRPSISPSTRHLRALNCTSACEDAAWTR